MIVIRARNVNDAWAQGVELARREGVRRDSRDGPVFVHPEPVTTVYERPCERVLLDPVRDANPIFHLHEALWMLAGRDDATWLDQFVSDFSARYAQDGGTMHGAYGKRWRGWFRRHRSGDAYLDMAHKFGITRTRAKILSLCIQYDLPLEPKLGDLGMSLEEATRMRALVAEFSSGEEIDQLDECVRLLRANPLDRQAVIQMWDPSADLGVTGLRDRPCNQQVLLRCDRTEQPYVDPPVTDQNSAEWELKIVEGRLRRYLDITVPCRSNDLVMGCYGANAVHMSILHEYLAARIGVEVGRYTQVSNNWHMYERDAAKADQQSADEGAARKYPGLMPLVTNPETIDEDIRSYCNNPSNEGGRMMGPPWKNSFLGDTARVMFLANEYRRKGQLDSAIYTARDIAAPDWRDATVAWLERRRRK